MTEILDQSIKDIAQAVREKRITAVALAEQTLARIDAVNADLNAVVSTNPELTLKYAAQADADLAEGKSVGPLHGVPMTIKDSLDTFDFITTWGTQGRAAFRPGRDASVVARLRSAGAILVGKTNTPEFTLAFQTDNNLFGRTNNPYDLTRTSGGSSGGAAALIASRAIPFDIGTDTGGSIRLPAHFCGIAGLKPTSGRVPCSGNALPSEGLWAPLSQPGPMTRFAQDLSLLLDIIEGPDLFDPNVRIAPKLQAQDIDPKSLRIGFHLSNGLSAPTLAIQAALQSVIDKLANQGMDLREHRPDGIEMTPLIFSRLLAADDHETVLDLLERSNTETPSLAIASNLSQPKPGFSAAELCNILAIWDGFKSAMLKSFATLDVLICPVNAHTAIPHGQAEDMLDYTYTMTYNLTGWPSVVIPCGLDEAGLPIGLQLIAAPFREDQCLALAEFIQSELDFFPVPLVNSMNSGLESAPKNT
ncbi:MAG TPA: amidase [Gammaproteobacteria bacterium]|jgi:amidase|nr:amidase [Gammaproteobacteria bacterium]MDC1329059.1 amidase [Pseudomonadales bacterium]MBT7886818.1 amidase [Gammaproteobacteria bacterium]MDC3356967.1 amidase [Pseudomonadales bacterium]HAF37460.1 amidase [Gammaproteobacteria bacterium]